MQSKYLIASLIALGFLISGCSDGTSEGSSAPQATIVKVIKCDNSNATSATDDCGNALVPNHYTCIQGGDSLVQESSGTTVEILHDSKNNKKVCVKSGSAHLIR